MGHEARSDAELLAAAGRGDDDAFARLVRRHIRAATLLAAQLLGDPDEAEDIVQDAWTIVHREANAFDGARPFPPWFFAIVRRMAANRRAREFRRARLMRWRGAEAVSPIAPAPSDEVLSTRLDAEAARRAMEDLSPMQRACFELVTDRDLSIEEVAAMHGISESTVRQHLFRARAALRGALGSEQLEREER